MSVVRLLTFAMLFAAATLELALYVRTGRADHPLLLIVTLVALPLVAAIGARDLAAAIRADVRREKRERLERFLSS